MLFCFGFDVGDEGRLEAGESGLVNHFAFVNAVRQQPISGERNELTAILIAVLADPLSFLVETSQRNEPGWRSRSSVLLSRYGNRIVRIIGASAVGMEEADESFSLLRRQQGDSLDNFLGKQPTAYSFLLALISFRPNETTSAKRMQPRPAADGPASDGFPVRCSAPRNCPEPF